MNTVRTCLLLKPGDKLVGLIKYITRQTNERSFVSFYYSVKIAEEITLFNMFLLLMPPSV